MRFFIDKPILDHAPRTRLAVVRFEGAHVGYGHGSLDDMRLRVVNRIREEASSSQLLKGIPQIAGTEELLAKFDTDMRRTTTRCEALLRKLLEGGALPVENDAVDLATLLTLYYKLPVTLSDAREIRGDVGLVVGARTRPFEVVQGHDPIRTEGRLFLRDDVGYFASPIAQGKRALVTERTTALLACAIFPPNVGDSIVRDFLKRCANWYESLCQAEVVQDGMVGQAEAEE